LADSWRTRAGAQRDERPPAHAHTDGYLADLQQHIPNVYQRYGAQALLNEGMKVCNWAAQGVPDIGSSTGVSAPTASGAIVDRIMDDLPMSTDAAARARELADQISDALGHLHRLVRVLDDNDLDELASRG
jgi:hypothetical protein